MTSITPPNKSYSDKQLLQSIFPTNQNVHDYSEITILEITTKTTERPEKFPEYQQITPEYPENPPD